MSWTAVFQYRWKLMVRIREANSDQNLFRLQLLNFYISID